MHGLSLVALCGVLTVVASRRALAPGQVGSVVVVLDL